VKERGTVTCRAASKAVSLHDTGKTFAFAGARNIDDFAYFKDSYVDGLPTS